jgi:light-harvesting complex 1 beta chain
MAREEEKGSTEKANSYSGLTDVQAKEFHGIFVASFLGFTAIAIVAHVLAWMWRPWLPGVNGYGLIETVQTVTQSMMG